MRVFLTLLKREQFRYLCQPLGYLMFLGYFIVQFFNFYSLVEALSRPSPFYYSPLYLLTMGGFVLFLLALFIPALAMRMFSEEKSIGTWDALLCTGASRVSIVLAKFISAWFNITIWVCSPLLFVILLKSNQMIIDWSLLVTGFGGLIFVTGQWLAIAMFIGCFSRSVILSWIYGCIALFSLYYFIPQLVYINFENAYTLFFKSIDVGRLLGRTSKGQVDLFDLVYLLTTTFSFLVLTLYLVDSEGRYKSQFKRLLFGFGIFGALFMFCLSSMHIANRHKTSWSLSSSMDKDLSPEFADLIKKAPEGLKISVAMPGNANVPRFNEAKNFITQLVKKIGHVNPKIKTQFVDPDLNITEYNRIKRDSHIDNDLGGLIIDYQGKIHTIPYHYLIRLKIHPSTRKMVSHTIEGFYGEQQIALALTQLTRQDEPPHVLILRGHHEIDLNDTGKHGASKFKNLLLQAGMTLEEHIPGIIENPDLSKYDLVLWLDPRTAITNATRNILDQIYERQIPFFVCKSPPGSHEAGQPFQALAKWGLETKGFLVMKEGAIPTYFETMSYTNHPIAKNITGRKSVVIESDMIAATPVPNPNIKTKVVLNSFKPKDKDAHSGIVRMFWATSRATDFSNPSKASLTRDYQRDFPAPHPIVGTAQLDQDQNTTIPLLTLIASRSLIDNTFINQGVNRSLVFNSIDWLLHGEQKMYIPPRQLTEYHFKINEHQIFYLLLLAGLPLPLLLIFMSIFIFVKRK